MEKAAPIRMHSFAIPINEDQARYLLAFQLLAPYATEVAKGFLPPVVEDRIMIESQQGAVLATTGECHVPSDQATLIFRRWYHQSIVRQSAQI